MSKRNLTGGRRTVVTVATTAANSNSNSSNPKSTVSSKSSKNSKKVQVEDQSIVDESTTTITKKRNNRSKTTLNDPELTKDDKVAVGSSTEKRNLRQISATTKPKKVTKTDVEINSNGNSENGVDSKIVKPKRFVRGAKILSSPNSKTEVSNDGEKSPKNSKSTKTNQRIVRGNQKVIVDNGGDDYGNVPIIQSKKKKPSSTSSSSSAIIATKKLPRNRSSKDDELSSIDVNGTVDSGISNGQIEEDKVDDIPVRKSPKRQRNNRKQNMVKDENGGDDNRVATSSTLVPNRLKRSKKLISNEDIMEYLDKDDVDGTVGTNGTEIESNDNDDGDDGKVFEVSEPRRSGRNAARAAASAVAATAGAAEVPIIPKSVPLSSRSKTKSNVPSIESKQNDHESSNRTSKRLAKESSLTSKIQLPSKSKSKQIKTVSDEVIQQQQQQDKPKLMAKSKRSKTLKTKNIDSVPAAAEEVEKDLITSENLEEEVEEEDNVDTQIVDEKTLKKKSAETRRVKFQKYAKEKYQTKELPRSSHEVSSSSVVVVGGNEDNNVPQIEANDTSAILNSPNKRKLNNNVNVTVDIAIVEEDDEEIESSKRVRIVDDEQKQDGGGGNLFTFGEGLGGELGPRIKRFGNRKVNSNEPSMVKLKLKDLFDPVDLDDSDEDGQDGQDGQEEDNSKLIQVKQVSCGAYHTIVLTTDGRVMSFGCKDDATLGRVLARPEILNNDVKNETLTNMDDDQEYEEMMAAKPQPLIEIKTEVRKVSAGEMHGAALTKNGQVFVWGNFKGEESYKIGMFSDDQQDSDDDYLPTILPRLVEFGNNNDNNLVVAIDIASGCNHLLILTKTGSIYSFGEGSKGQLGRIDCDNLGSIRSNRKLFLKPGLIQLPKRNGEQQEEVGTKAAKIFASHWFSYAVTPDGALYAWGLNNYHQLGFRTKRLVEVESGGNSYTMNLALQLFPVMVDTRFTPGETFSSKIVKVTNGQQHQLLLDQTGSVYSCGSVRYGKLGHGEEFTSLILSESDDKCLDRPMLIPTVGDSFGSDPIVDIGCGDFCSYAISKSGRCYSWGQGAKHIGTDTGIDRFIPQPITGGPYAECCQFWQISCGALFVALIGSIQTKRNEEEEE